MAKKKTKPTTTVPTKLSPWGRVIEAAAQALRDANMSREGASKLLSERLHEDKELGACAIVFAAREAVQAAAVRTHVINAHASVKTLSRASARIIETLRDEVGGVLRAWSLRSGVVLADATRSHLVDEIKHYRTAALALNSKADLLQRVLDKMPDSDTAKVSDVLTDDEFAALAEVGNG